MDAEFGHPRLAGIYDALDPDRSDLAPYLRLVEELGGRRVLDVGCGTGTFALLLAHREYDVVGLDPAAASLAVARGKPGAHLVRWVEGDVHALTVSDRDVATMTANVAQAIATPDDWAMTLSAVHRSLVPGGTLVLETRDPSARGWEEWTREATLRTVVLAEAGEVTHWTEVTSVEWPLVRFRSTWQFAIDGAVLTSSSTLRFRTAAEVAADLQTHGYDVVEVREAPDRPGSELVVIARAISARGASQRKREPDADDAPEGRRVFEEGSLPLTFSLRRLGRLLAACPPGLRALHAVQRWQTSVRIGDTGGAHVDAQLGKTLPGSSAGDRFRREMAATAGLS